MTAYKPKLIEVALPLAAINRAAAKEKTMGAAPHPQNIHRWWARRPLAAARAVLWASLVDDPSCDESISKEEQESERMRLFEILEQLVKWENSNNHELLTKAKAEIDRCFPDGVPEVVDPFGGGGAIPYEAQRLGLKARSGDLNPVAVLIQKAMLEIPPRFVGRSPVHPAIDRTLTTWTGARGLAADVEKYGASLQQMAASKIEGHYGLSEEAGAHRATPLAWIWARTVESPDPSWHGQIPLVASWTLSRKKGKPKVWVEPAIDREQQSISYRVRVGGEPSFLRTVTRGNATCIATGAAVPGTYIKAEAQAGRMGTELIAVIAQTPEGRVYLSPEQADRESADCPEPDWRPVGRNPERLTGGTVVTYGLDEWSKLFTRRQLLALTTFSDCLVKIRSQALEDALAAGLANDEVRLRDGGNGAAAYADALVTYLAFNIDKCAEHWCSLCSWHERNEQVRNVFARQALPMTWDFVEVNPFSKRMGSWDSQLKGLVGALRECLATPLAIAGVCEQRDARARIAELAPCAVSTDPPYYDNISYGDLSDFFFVWLRRNLSDVWPEECATLSTPKSQELIANQHRAGSKKKAEEHFESGMAEFMAEVAKAQPSQVPATIYYAYKATETKEGEIRSTGWDTFLQGVLDSGMQVTATWPMRTELGNRLLASKANALASSIVLTCRTRGPSAPLASRGEFITALRSELPDAVRLLQSGNIAPVDLAQSTIGPGIKVFSRYAKVVEANGSAMSVADALAIINDVLGELLDGEEAELDRDTRFALTWYAQNGFDPGHSGDADAQARAKNTSLAGIEESGIGEARSGQFRLLLRSELDPEWDPGDDNRLTVWEATQHLAAALERSETEAADLLNLMGGYADRARQLAYVLFQKATDRGWTEEAGVYNGLITVWPSLQAMGGRDGTQGTLL